MGRFKNNDTICDIKNRQLTSCRMLKTYNNFFQIINNNFNTINSNLP